jgi:hypothetical protein
MITEPLMFTTINVDQHPGQGAARPPLAMDPALASFLHQPSSLQCPFHPRVTQLDVMVRNQLLVKMPHIEIEVCSLYNRNTSSTVVNGTCRSETRPRRRSIKPV